MTRASDAMATAARHEKAMRSGEVMMISVQKEYGEYGLRIRNEDEKKNKQFFLFFLDPFSCRPLGSSDRAKHLQGLVDHPWLNGGVYRREMVRLGVLLERCLIVVCLEKKEMSGVVFIDGNVEAAATRFLEQRAARIDQYGLLEVGNVFGLDLEIDGYDVHGGISLR